jgi:hypothetical protein
MTDVFKATLRVPTAEPYAYIEITVEDTPEAIFEAHRRFSKLTKVGVGLPTKDWNGILDNYRKGKGMSADQMERMDEQQAFMIHELDKSNNRLKK